MKVLVLGCGEMGETAIQDLYEFGPFHEIVVGTRSVAHAREVLGRLSGRPVRVSAEEVDVKNEGALAGLMAGSAVVVNCAGPNYQNEVPVARAALRAKVNLVDINDDYETTYERETGAPARSSSAASSVCSRARLYQGTPGNRWWSRW